ncbi:MAG TPA: hypothetical protein VGQ44_02510 [Gemmatimonadaceae bacterium]|nr:hypothetical protein [Gemmatimonadaceae bacterium]
MRLLPRPRPYLLGLSFVLACNNNSSTTGTNSSFVTNGTFTATVNGTSWSAVGPVGVRRPVANAFGITAISTTYTMSFAINGVTAAGTFNVGASGLQGSQVLVSTLTNASWVSNNAGGTGTVTFTTVAPNHIVGTFVFDAPPLPGTTGTLHVTNGVFNLTY